MKRSISNGQFISTDDDEIEVMDLKKKTKIEPEKEEEMSIEVESVLFDENLLYEVLKHVDARTLAASACVSKRWKKTAEDERIWELICTQHYARNILQLRAVVLALGGFRRLYSLYLLPLLKPSSSSASSSSSATTASTSTWPCLPTDKPAPAKNPAGGGVKSRWGKDEVNLSLSLLSIRYFEKMDFSNKKK